MELIYRVVFLLEAIYARLVSSNNVGTHAHLERPPRQPLHAARGRGRRAAEAQHGQGAQRHGTQHEEPQRGPIHLRVAQLQHAVGPGRSGRTVQQAAQPRCQLQTGFPTSAYHRSSLLAVSSA